MKNWDNFSKIVNFFKKFYQKNCSIFQTFLKTNVVKCLSLSSST